MWVSSVYAQAPQHLKVKLWTVTIGGGHWTVFVAVKVKIKQSRYRPGVVQRVPGILKFPGFMTRLQDGGKVVSITHRPPLPPGNTPGTHFY